MKNICLLFLSLLLLTSCETQTSVQVDILMSLDLNDRSREQFQDLLDRFLQEESGYQVNVRYIHDDYDLMINAKYANRYDFFVANTALMESFVDESLVHPVSQSVFEVYPIQDFLFDFRSSLAYLFYDNELYAYPLFTSHSALYSRSGIKNDLLDVLDDALLNQAIIYADFDDMLYQILAIQDVLKPDVLKTFIEKIKLAWERDLLKNMGEQDIDYYLNHKDWDYFIFNSLSMTKIEDHHLSMSQDLKIAGESLPTFAQALYSVKKSEGNEAFLLAFVRFAKRELEPERSLPAFSYRHHQTMNLKERYQVKKKFQEYFENKVQIDAVLSSLRKGA